MSRLLPKVQGIDAGCFRLRSVMSGYLYDATNATMSSTTTLANSLIALTEDTVTGEFAGTIPSAVPIGKYELTIYDIVKASVTNASTPYKHVLIRLDSSGEVVLL